MIRPRRAVAALVALAAIGALAACGPDSASSARGGTCLDAPVVRPAPSSPSTSAGSGGGAVRENDAGAKLPALSLACFDGTGKVKPAILGRPAVINLWAAWCPPCRAELPGIQEFAKSGAVTVIGVDTADTHKGGASVIQDMGLTYPMLSDPDKSLANALGRSSLPVTLFVDSLGTVRYVYASATPLTSAALTQLVAEYLGVGG